MPDVPPSQSVNNQDKQEKNGIHAKQRESSNRKYIQKKVKYFWFYLIKREKKCMHIIALAILNKSFHAH